MTSAALPAPIMIPRQATGALVQHLGLTLGSLGSALIDFHPDAGYNSAIVQWWTSLAPRQRIPREVLATLAAPTAVAEIRVIFQKSSLFRTWAMTGGLAPNSQWVLVAHHEAKDEYQVQQLPDRQTLVNTLFAYLESGVPVWEAQMRFRLPAAEFAVLLALLDLYSRGQYASLITHAVAPASYSFADVQQAYQNATEFPDLRYLFPFAEALLPDVARQLTPSDVQALTGKLVEHGLLKVGADGFAWTDPGRFLAESLHRRTCALLIDAAGATAKGAVGSQGSLFVRSDQPLWYFDIERGATPHAVVAGVTADLARSLLDEILQPVGVPPSHSEVQARRAAMAAHRPLPIVAAPPYYQAPPTHQPQAGASSPFCRNCGVNLPPGVRFCVGCGSPTG
ncbi:MAG: zinc ribbon domain-containing protein [Acidobacteria bacterium]|nr:zinc ribbon domain-containing protein [Acidobacteriota bacterium]